MRKITARILGSFDGAQTRGSLCAVSAVGRANRKMHGVPTPINEAVVRMIKEIEDSQRKMTPENLKDQVFANL